MMYPGMSVDRLRASPSAVAFSETLLDLLDLLDLLVPLDLLDLYYICATNHYDS